ncbi:hypothetical protein GCM10023149_21800 [Mucilaginibacter gynuensis]|uniref:Uncharacterized protein n=1 Tax=Mucilaginibacter gynuensis TaxID=1302236 RepID=A0ABP8GD10_9SPHI
MNYQEHYNNRLTAFNEAKQLLLNEELKIKDNPFTAQPNLTGLIDAKSFYDAAFNKWVEVITSIAYYEKKPDDAIDLT